MSKNLFESTIDSIKTPENTVYMEAVVDLFNILFEDQIGNIVDKDSMFPLSGVEFDDLPQHIQEQPRDALNRIASFIEDKGRKVQQADNSRDKFMKTYVPEKQITELTTAQRPSTSNISALKMAKEALKDLASMMPTSKAALQQTISNMTKVYTHDDIQVVKNLAKMLVEFFNAVQKGYKWVTTEYSRTKTPDMYTEKKPEGKKEKETFVTKEMLDNMGEQSDASKKMDDAAKPVKDKSKTKEVEPPKVVDPMEEYKMIKFATVDTQNSSRQVTMTGVTNVEGVVESLRHAIDVVSDARYKYIRKECLSVSGDTKERTVTVTVNDNNVTSISTNERKNATNLFTKYNVLLYSLFMYVKNLFRMDENCIMSESTAKSIVHDMTNGNKSALSSLFPSGNDESLDISNILNVGVVKSILTNSGITDKNDLDNLAFAITQCTSSLGDSKLNNGQTIADRNSQMAEQEDDSEKIKASKAKLKEAFDEERNSFNHNVASIAGSATNSSFDIYGLDTSEEDMHKIDNYAKMLDESNVYEKIVDKLNSASEESDNASDVKLNGSYAEDASRVVASCEQIMKASDTTFKLKTIKEDPVSDLDFNQMLSTDSLLDELSSAQMSPVESNADFDPDHLR